MESTCKRQKKSIKIRDLSGDGTDAGLVKKRMHPADKIRIACVDRRQFEHFEPRFSVPPSAIPSNQRPLSRPAKRLPEGDVCDIR
jgi:hypothetical protein